MENYKAEFKMEKNKKQQMRQIMSPFFRFICLGIILHLYLSFCFLIFDILFTQEKKPNAICYRI